MSFQNYIRWKCENRDWNPEWNLFEFDTCGHNMHRINLTLALSEIQESLQTSGERWRITTLVSGNENSYFIENVVGINLWGNSLFEHANQNKYTAKFEGNILSTLYYSEICVTPFSMMPILKRIEFRFIIACISFPLLSSEYK